MPITDLTALPASAAPQWLAGVGLPAGWRTGRYVGDEPTEPCRVAVRGERDDGRWDACETITAFSFLGFVEALDVWEICESSLHALNAENVVIVEIVAPAVPGVALISGSGEFHVQDRFIHGQFNYYAVGSTGPGQGRMIQQCLYVDAGRRAELEANLAVMGNELHNAFINSPWCSGDRQKGST
jgi:hypothetical protein